MVGKLLWCMRNETLQDMPLEKNDQRPQGGSCDSALSHQPVADYFPIPKVSFLYHRKVVSAERIRLINYGSENTSPKYLTHALLTGASK